MRGMTRLQYSLMITFVVILFSFTFGIVFGQGGEGYITKMHGILLQYEPDGDFPSTIDSKGLNDYLGKMKGHGVSEKDAINQLFEGSKISESDLVKLGEEIDDDDGQKISESMEGDLKNENYKVWLENYLKTKTGQEVDFGNEEKAFYNKDNGKTGGEHVKIGDDDVTTLSLSALENTQGFEINGEGKMLVKINNGEVELRAGETLKSAQGNKVTIDDYKYDSLTGTSMTMEIDVGSGDKIHHESLKEFNGYEFSKPDTTLTLKDGDKVIGEYGKNVDIGRSAGLDPNSPSKIFVTDELGNGIFSNTAAKTQKFATATKYDGVYVGNDAAGVEGLVKNGQIEYTLDASGNIATVKTSGFEPGQYQTVNVDKQVCGRGGCEVQSVPTQQLVKEGSSAYFKPLTQGGENVQYSVGGQTGQIPPAATDGVIFTGDAPGFTPPQVYDARGNPTASADPRLGTPYAASGCPTCGQGGRGNLGQGGGGSSGGGGSGGGGGGSDQSQGQGQDQMSQLAQALQQFAGQIQGAAGQDQGDQGGPATGPGPGGNYAGGAINPGYECSCGPEGCTCPGNDCSICGGEIFEYSGGESDVIQTGETAIV